MDETLTLAKRLRQDSEEQLQTTSENVKRLCQSLEKNLSDSLAAVESSSNVNIGQLTESINWNLERSTKAFNNNLKTGLVLNGILYLLIILVVVIALLSAYWRWELAGLREEIKENKSYLLSQEESLRKGRFYRDPEDGKRYVEIVRNSQYRAQSGRFWAEMKQVR